MTEASKNKAVVWSVAALLLVLSLWAWLRPADAASNSERRPLAQLPALSGESVLRGDFAESFETYALDQFPARDSFRTLKALSVTGLFRQKDNNGLYTAEGHVSKLEYPLRAEMLDNAAEKFRALYTRYLQGMPVYFSIIPDKNAFLAAENGVLSMDYDAFYARMREKTDFMEYINITDLLCAEDYYRTDSHWRQEAILPVAERLASAMGAELSQAYTERELERPFYGVYAGQSALPLQPDTIHYLESETLRACVVTSYDTGAPLPSALYDLKKAQGRDAYDLFLSGGDALLRIENPNAATDKELILFRDSFGSSLAPLLAAGYRTITLVDIRYLQSELLDSFIDFDAQDVLFLYSTSLLNNSAVFQ